MINVHPIYSSSLSKVVKNIHRKFFPKSAFLNTADLYSKVLYVHNSKLVFPQYFVLATIKVMVHGELQVKIVKKYLKLPILYFDFQLKQERENLSF